MLKRFSLLLIAAALLASAAVAQDPKAALAYAIGNGRSADGSTGYGVSATAPSMSADKGHQFKFSVSRSGFGGGMSWNYFMVGTGKSKSVAQVQTMLATALRKFPGSPAGTELCKIGDIKYGGELKLVVRGPNELEFAFDPAIRTGNPRLTAADALAFAAILGK